MSRKEVPRAGLLKAALAGRISNAQGALALHLSLRQFQRVKVAPSASLRSTSWTGIRVPRTTGFPTGPLWPRLQGRRARLAGITFVTAGARLLRAAQAEGLTVMNPERAAARRR